MQEDESFRAKAYLLARRGGLRQTWDSSIKDNSAEMLIIVRKKCKDKHLFLAIDVANKKGIYHMVKIISF